MEVISDNLVPLFQSLMANIASRAVYDEKYAYGPYNNYALDMIKRLAMTCKAGMFVFDEATPLPAYNYLAFGYIRHGEFETARMSGPGKKSLSMTFYRFGEFCGTTKYKLQSSGDNTKASIHVRLHDDNWELCNYNFESTDFDWFIRNAKRLEWPTYSKDFIDDDYRVSIIRDDGDYTLIEELLCGVAEDGSSGTEYSYRSIDPDNNDAKQLDYDIECVLNDLYDFSI